MDSLRRRSGPTKGLNRIASQSGCAPKEVSAVASEEDLGLKVQVAVQYEKPERVVFVRRAVDGYRLRP